MAKLITLDKHLVTRSDSRFITDQQIVTLLIYNKPLIAFSIFILCYTKPILLVMQLLRLAIAHHIWLLNTSSMAITNKQGPYFSVTICLMDEE